ncbi:Gfo/Idh/MocA family oxidoreductase [Propionibacterium freudenreichii]|uniref:Gfo/Idh/MocA family protein n=1 Tax=Propionibacterium freudenreichii TaxID=1744 RepID=UPI0024866DDB|nr:Gfo/Idh/MocA family oxidoreductase [Propionibacterium freudenreichii]MDK9295144.1 Gfo/Idh/MocA family oxidoreductase [Propionibacterium freudenreichii]MDK9360513.1 Gfo/Idh/MocA family oxidoreductase [Propionibacterium freudenreichii]MDK9640290.1 Gfo/Idh/MocA family oxidoreductase [Propionibacterium freudenreichii]WGU89921.1 Gfo/Idh/MocA family oxidoreductase [Propionibacterium freudenreichii]
MSTTVRIALIGAGYAGQSHAFGYRNAQLDDSLNGVELILGTVVDPNQQLADYVKGKYCFRQTGSDISQVVARDDIDIVSLALPNRMYIDVVPPIMRSGKHVFCEKPLGLDAAEAQQMVSAAAEAGVVNAVGFSFRRIPALAALHEYVKAGRLGDIEWFNAHYFADYAADPRQPRTWRYVMEESGGGAIADIGAHALDTVRYVVGDLAEVVSTSLTTLITERPLPAGGIGHSQKASETERGAVTNDDNALVSLKAESGAIGTVTLSRIATGVPNDLAIEVHGTKGWARFSSARMDELTLFEQGVSEAGSDGARTIVAGPAFPYFASTAAMPGRGVGTGYDEAFMAEIQEFVGAVLGHGEVSNPFATAIPTMKAIAAAQQSARSGRPVKID